MWFIAEIMENFELFSEAIYKHGGDWRHRKMNVRVRYPSWTSLNDQRVLGAHGALSCSLSLLFANWLKVDKWCLGAVCF